MTRNRLGPLALSLLALSLAGACSSGSGGDGNDAGQTQGATEGATEGPTDGDDTEGPADDSGDGPPLSCGNGVLDEGEACDGEDFGGLSCADFGGDTGSLACSACEIDASACDLQPATHFGEASSWSLPEGGDALEGFYALGGSEWDEGDQSWSIADLTGDGRPDLVVTNEDGSPIMSGSDQFWWVYPNTGDGFGEPEAWSLPAGGDAVNGFYALGGSEWGEGDQSWSVADLTGDGRPDLVITNADGEPIMGGGAQYWWVHPNTGDGFGEATTWALPEGGDGVHGFHALGGSEWDEGDQSWSVTDLSGDGRPDLIITNADGEPIVGGGGQYWWVHPNTGEGFGEVTTWPLPEGGDAINGFYALGGSEWDEGDQSWTTTDLTGDGRPDLVITNADGDPIEAGGGQYWWVHPNTGDGFGEVTTWPLPAGGDALEGFYALGGSEWDEGDQSWTTADMTGDGRPDLVITNADGDPIVDAGGDQYWWVHPNTGEGFGEVTSWGLPRGGDAAEGYYALAGSEWDAGDQSWSTLDLDGDHRPDLVITNADGDPLPGPSWQVHRGEP